MSNSLNNLVSDLAEGKFSTRQVALAYARLGIAVFPLKPGTKVPANSNGHRGATTDRETIEGWFCDGNNYNIGVVPGTGGWFVIDIDVEKDGFATLPSLNLPPTLMVRTGRGGVHCWFRVPPNRLEELKRHGGQSNSGKLGKGIDTRFTQGYLVSPPSKTTGGYHWMLPGKLEAAND